MTKHKSYKEIKKTFSKERIDYIESGANQIKKELKLLAEVSKAVNLTQEELAILLNMGQSDIPEEVKEGKNITIHTLISMIKSMGGSIDVTVNFPDKPCIYFSEIEKLMIFEDTKQGRN